MLNHPLEGKTVNYLQTIFKASIYPCICKKTVLHGPMLILDLQDMVFKRSWKLLKSNVNQLSAAQKAIISAHGVVLHYQRQALMPAVLEDSV